jgi:pyroglutamyl-peptidase
MLTAPVVLLTGFEPFGGETANASERAVQALHGAALAGHRVVGARLPVTFGDARGTLERLIRQYRPVLVIATGQAGGRAALSLERVAINVDDARIADNAGRQPVDCPVVAGGPAAYFSSLPIKAMHAELARNGVAAEVSQTAGTFVCNHVFYGLMHLLAIDPTLAGVRGGFIHLPWLPTQGHPSLPLESAVSGLALAIQTALVHRSADLQVAAGATH